VSVAKKTSRLFVDDGSKSRCSSKAREKGSSRSIFLKRIEFNLPSGALSCSLCCELILKSSVSPCQSEREFSLKSANHCPKTWNCKIAKKVVIISNLLI